MATQIKSLDVSRIAGSVGTRLLAAIFLVYFTPLMLAVAFMIKFDSRGPIFVRHSRRAPNGELFELWGFRTVSGVDNGSIDATGPGGQTEVGAFLAETRLEMLPRLVNMLRGEVSFGSLLR